MGRKQGRLFFVLAMACLLAQAPIDAQAPVGAAELAGALVRGSAHLFSAENRQALDEINRQAREAKRDEEDAQTDEARAEAIARGEAAGGRLLEILNASDVGIPVSLAGDTPFPARMGPLTLTGDSASFVFRISAGDSETRCTSADIDLSTAHGPIEIEAAPSGVAWALLKLRRCPVGPTSLRLAVQMGPDRRVTLPFDITAPDFGRLKLTVLSDDTGTPAPAMVRLIRREDWQTRRPSNAVEFAPIWDGFSSSEHRYAALPGKLRGHYWCVPEPFDMELPPGEWEVTVRRGTRARDCL